MVSVATLIASFRRLRQPYPEGNARNSHPPAGGPGGAARVPPRARGPRGEPRGDHVGDQGPRLGPWNRNEPVGRLRLRQEGTQLEEDPASLLPPDQDLLHRRRRGQG